jgi:hypothetical protein
MAGRNSRRFKWLLVGGALLLTQAGCEPSEKQQWREAAKVAREHRAFRQAAHREALPAIRALRDDIVPARTPTSRCGKEVRIGARAVDGVLPVACGNLGESWPLTIQYGFLRCLVARWDPPGLKVVVITAPSGRDYAVTRTGRYVGYERIAPIFKDDAGPRYGSALTKIGSQLCK